jgi:hypothetical protein
VSLSAQAPSGTEFLKLHSESSLILSDVRVSSGSKYLVIEDAEGGDGQCIERALSISKSFVDRTMLDGVDSIIAGRLK